MKIITGAVEVPQITSNNDGEFNQAIWGDKLVVLPNGSQLGYELISNTSVRILDGDLVFQGRHALIEAGDYDTVNIAAGQNGYNRIDLIVAHYAVDSNGYESMTLRVIKGTATTGTPSAPSYTQGTIRTGSLVAEEPLYRVRLTGINIALTMVATIADSDLLDLINSKQPIINGAVSNIVNTNLAANKIAVTNGSGKLDVSSVNASQLNYLTGLTGNVQSQIGGKQSVITGAASTVTESNLSAEKVLVSNDGGKISASEVGSDKLAYLANVTSDIQAQINSKNIEKGSTFNSSKLVATDDNKKLYTLNVTPTEANYMSGLTGKVQTQLDGKATKASTWNTHRVVVTDDNKNVTTSNITDEKLAFLSDVTSNIQAQINSKQTAISGGATTITTENLANNRALISTNNGKVAVSDITATELSYLDNASSNIQTQLNSKANKSGWTVNKTLATNANGEIIVATPSLAELNRLAGVTSDIQPQLNARVQTSKVIANQSATTTLGTGTVVANHDTATSLGSFTLDAGKYAVNLYCDWEANASGVRTIWLSLSDRGSVGTRAWVNQVESANTGETMQNLSVVVTPTQRTTYYFVARHRAGAGKRITVKNVRYSIFGIKA